MNNVNQKYRQRAFKPYPEDKELSWSVKPRPKPKGEAKKMVR
jgi:hypothetical protein